MTTQFKFSYQDFSDEAKNILLCSGEIIYVLGANGVGKSGLMHELYTQNKDRAKRISAHRQTWLPSNTSYITPTSRNNIENDINRSDENDQSRWKEDRPKDRVYLAIFNLINSENMRARKITSLVESEEWDVLETEKIKPSPINIINRLMRNSNIPIEFSIGQDEQIFATKNNSHEYSIAELSDGERNAFLLAANVLTAKTDSLLIIDEPERHLHRSIISP